MPERTEYKICAENHNGQMFVPHAFQADLDKALEIYDNYRNSMEAKAHAAVVTIERRVIITKIEDFTDVADKMLEDKND